MMKTEDQIRARIERIEKVLADTDMLNDPTGYFKQVLTERIDTLQWVLRGE